MQLRIHKMGNKLGLYLPRNYYKKSKLLKGELIEVYLKKSNDYKEFITKFNYNIVIRRDVIKLLNLKANELVDVKINKIDNAIRSRNLFENDKIDLLSLIPERTNRSYEIIVNKFNKNNGEWLRIWYSHNRGSSRQIEIKRFVNIEIFGRLLGQYQAEGTKNSKKKFRLEFTNKLIKEHLDFIIYLEQIGLSRENIIANVTFHPDVKDINKKIKDFEKQTLIKVKSKIKSPRSKGSYGFRTCIMSSLLLDIILNSLKLVKNELINKEWNNNHRKLVNNFFAKLLTGDGTLDIRIKNRKYNYPSTRVKITDGNFVYLKEYVALMKKLGFYPKISQKFISVRANLDFEKLFYLYKIKAFKNTNNWNKLITLIDIHLNGRRLKTNYRFMKLINHKTFTHYDVAKIFNLSSWGSKDWLYNKEKEGLVRRLNINNKVPVWELNNKALDFIYVVKEWQKDLNKLKEEKRIQDSNLLLESLKTRL